MHPSHHVHAAVEGVDASLRGWQLQASGGIEGQIKSFVEIWEDHLGHAAARINPVKRQP